MASYTWEQKVRAVERYLSCGGRALDVIRELGYPGCAGSLLRWVRAMAPGGREAVRRRPVPRGVREALLEACASGCICLMVCVPVCRGVVDRVAGEKLTM